MSNYYDQVNAYSSKTGNSPSISERVLQLTGAAAFYRALKDWQSEFKPRLYEKQHVPIVIEKQAVRLNFRRR